MEKSYGQENASDSEIYDKYYDNNARKTEASTYIKVNYTLNNFNVYGDIQYRQVNYNFEGLMMSRNQSISINKKSIIL